MPRSRRRHHSRSRTRSRSHSYDRDREPKRRKIESYDSPQHKRSLSPESNEENEEQVQTLGAKRTLDDKQADSGKTPTGTEDTKEKITSKSEFVMDVDGSENEGSPKSPDSNHKSKTFQTVDDSSSVNSKDLNTSAADSESHKSDLETPSDPKTSQNSDANVSKDCYDSVVIEIEDEAEGAKNTKKSVTSNVLNSTVTPKKTLSPKQAQKKLESKKQREEKRKEREKKKQEMLEEKLKILQEKKKLREEKEQQKLKEKQEKQEQKQKEIEEKQKEKELKEEIKKKEREEKEQKRKEKEERNEQKRKDLEEKNKEKQKQEEKKQKAAAAFANFFTKRAENVTEEKKSEENSSASTFMPFEVKSGMRVAPVFRKTLTDDQKTELITALQKQTGKMYLEELKAGKEIGRSDKTWPPEDRDFQEDVVIVEDINPGESIEEQSKTNDKMRAKFLKFADNRRPAYFGTWRKKSKFVKPRKPLALDKEHFDYEIDSDEDWEEGEDTGESLRGSDDEDKENESENEYEVDNEFFVPHGYLSDDEVNDEENVISPEAHNVKLTLLKKEFEEEMKEKTHKIKPRVIGCIWYNKDGSNVDNAIREFLKPLSVISNGPVIIKKRSNFAVQTPLRRSSHRGKPLSIELIPDFLKLIHGYTKNRKMLIAEFLNYLNSKNIIAEVSQASLSKQVKQFAEWTRCSEDGPLHNKFCWIVRDSVKQEYNIDLSVSNNQ